MRSDTAFYRLAAILAGVSSVALTVPAAAQENGASEVAIPRMPLDRALLRVEQLTGARIRFDPDAARAARSAPVSSRDPASAVREALAGTGFAVTVEQDGSLSVTAPGADQEIVVTAQRDEAETSFRVNGAQSSNRSGKSLRELPQATQVITSALIRQQQAQTLNDALRNSAGVSPNGSVRGTFYSVRGLDSLPLQNGLATNITAPPVDTIERIEVLKGPAAILSGADNLGGTINIVDKRPSADPILDLTLQYATFGDKKIVLDASNALTADKTLSARIVAVAADGDRANFGYVGRGEYNFAPSIRYKTATSDIILGINTGSAFTPARPYSFFDADTARLRDVPERPIGPRRQGFTGSSNRYYASAEQIVTPWLTLVARGEASDGALQGPVYQPAFFPNPADRNLLYGFAFRLNNQTRSRAVDGYARLRFRTGPARHTLSAGYNHSDVSFRQFQQAEDPDGFPFAEIRLDTDTTGLPAPAPADVPAFSTRSKQDGIYIQDYVDLGPVHVLAAVRRTRYNQGSQSFDPVLGGPPTVDKTSQTTPSFGAVVDVSKSVSLYGNYVRGFNPIYSRTCSGERAPNTSSTNIEGGVKGDFFGGKLSAIASVFRLRQNNTTTTDFNCPGGNFDTVVSQDGRQTKGVEFNLNGEILPGLGLAASYTYSDFKYLSPDPFSGTFDSVSGLYRHKYSVYVNYQRRAGMLKGLGAAIGLFGNSSSVADFGGLYRVPPQAQVDGNLTYRLGKARLNLGIKNLFDKRLYDAGTYFLYIPITQPRTVTASLTYSFF